MTKSPNRTSTSSNNDEKGGIGKVQPEVQYDEDGKTLLLRIRIPSATNANASNPQESDTDQKRQSESKEVDKTNTDDDAGTNAAKSASSSPAKKVGRSGSKSSCTNFIASPSQCSSPSQTPRRTSKNYCCDPSKALPHHSKKKRSSMSPHHSSPRSQLKISQATCLQEVLDANPALMASLLEQAQQALEKCGNKQEMSLPFSSKCDPACPEPPSYICLPFSGRKIVNENCEEPTPKVDPPVEEVYVPPPTSITIQSTVSQNFFPEIQPEEEPVPEPKEVESEPEKPVEPTVKVQSVQKVEVEVSEPVKPSPPPSPPGSPAKTPPPSPPKTPPRSPVATPPRTPEATPPRSPEATPPRSPVSTPPRSPNPSPKISPASTPPKQEIKPPIPLPPPPCKSDVLPPIPLPPPPSKTCTEASQTMLYVSSRTQIVTPSSHKNQGTQITVETKVNVGAQTPTNQLEPSEGMASAVKVASSSTIGAVKVSSSVVVVAGGVPNVNVNHNQQISVLESNDSNQFIPSTSTDCCDCEICCCCFDGSSSRSPHCAKKDCIKNSRAKDGNTSPNCSPNSKTKGKKRNRCTQTSACKSTSTGDECGRGSTVGLRLGNIRPYNKHCDITNYIPPPSAYGGSECRQQTVVDQARAECSRRDLVRRIERIERGQVPVVCTIPPPNMCLVPQGQQGYCPPNMRQPPYPYPIPQNPTKCWRRSNST